MDVYAIINSILDCLRCVAGCVTVVGMHPGIFLGRAHCATRMRQMLVWKLRTCSTYSGPSVFPSICAKKKKNEMTGSKEHLQLLTTAANRIIFL